MGCEPLHLGRRQPRTPLNFEEPVCPRSSRASAARRRAPARTGYLISPANKPGAAVEPGYPPTARWGQHSFPDHAAGTVNWGQNSFPDGADFRSQSQPGNAGLLTTLNDALRVADMANRNHGAHDRTPEEVIWFPALITEHLTDAVTAPSPEPAGPPIANA
jgi:hypothetical protein